MTHRTVAVAVRALLDGRSQPMPQRSGFRLAAELRAADPAGRWATLDPDGGSASRAKQVVVVRGAGPLAPR